MLLWRVFYGTIELQKNAEREALPVMRKTRRTPKNYDGTGITSHQVSDVLSKALSQIGEVFQGRPDLVIAAWPEIVGQQLAGMTQAVSFIDGILTVKVKNSTLYSLMSQHDKPRMLQLLRQKFPKTPIKTIMFRIG